MTAEWSALDTRTKAAMISGLFVVVAAVLGSLTEHLVGGPPHGSPHPIVTVTTTVSPGPPTHTTAPQPTVTVTQYVAVSSGGGSSSWSDVAAVGTLLAGLGAVGGGIAAVGAMRRRQSGASAPDQRPKATDSA
jgi:hypothetical protein